MDAICWTCGELMNQTFVPGVGVLVDCPHCGESRVAEGGS